MEKEDKENIALKIMYILDNKRVTYNYYEYCHISTTNKSHIIEFLVGDLNYDIKIYSSSFFPDDVKIELMLLSNEHYDDQHCSNIDIDKYISEFIDNSIYFSKFWGEFDISYIRKEIESFLKNTNQSFTFSTKIENDLIVDIWYYKENKIELKTFDKNVQILLNDIVIWVKDKKYGYHLEDNNLYERLGEMSEWLKLTNC